MPFHVGQTKRQRLSGGRDGQNIDAATAAQRKDSEPRLRPIHQSESILERLVRESDSVQRRTKDTSVQDHIGSRKLLQSQHKSYGWFVPIDS